MLDIGWSELLVVAVVALIVVGPKELPSLLRTVGRFVNVIRRQANEFRSQFDEAIKDSEFEQVRKEFQEIKEGAAETIRDAERDIENEMRDLDEISSDIDRQLKANTDNEASGQLTDADVLATQHTKDLAGELPGDLAGDLAEDPTWIDAHNETVLEAEKEARANGSPTVADIDDSGAGQGTDHGAGQGASKTPDDSASRDKSSATDTAAQDGAPKAGAST